MQVPVLSTKRSPAWRALRAPGAALLLATIIAGACGGPEQPAMSPVPARMIRATLVGPLCEGAEIACKCREPGDDTGVPAPGYKRYEIRIGPAEDELWVAVGDMILYKSRERAEECFYVDLHPGKHPVMLRAEGPQGFGARLSISEQAAQGWYDTFAFQCGAPGRCAATELRDWSDALPRRYPRDVHDPCGSTKIRGVRWLAGRTLDRVHPDALQLDLVLDVYRFAPAHPPGDPACADAY